MDLQMAVLCDAATDYGGKLSILGAFDAIVAQKFPTVHPACAFAARFVYGRSDEGIHRVVLKIVDEDGKEIASPAELQANCQFPPGDRPFISQNLVLNMQRIQFQQPGRYSFDLSVDGEHRAAVPLLIIQHPGAAPDDEDEAPNDPMLD